MRLGSRFLVLASGCELGVTKFVSYGKPFEGKQQLEKIYSYFRNLPSNSSLRISKTLKHKLLKVKKVTSLSQRELQRLITASGSEQMTINNTSGAS